MLCDLLDGPRAHSAFVLRALLGPPWGLRVEDEAPLTAMAVARGWTWLAFEGEAPVRLDAGDVAIIQGGEPYLAGDAAEPVPQVVIDADGDCRDLDGNELHDAMALGVRSWGNDPSGHTVLLIGTYRFEGEIGRRLLGALPRHAVVPGEADDPLLALLADEATHDRPGQQAVLDRVLDLVLVASIRRWFDRPGADAPSWYAAAADPVVGPALRLFNDEPARRWTVQSVAAEVGVSRASLARRFREVMGEAPMAYLTELRLARAADLLRDPDATVASVAGQVGYDSPYAFSVAFRRERGIPPSTHRARALAEA